MAPPGRPTALRLTAAISPKAVKSKEKPAVLGRLTRHPVSPRYSNAVASYGCIMQLPVSPAAPSLSPPRGSCITATGLQERSAKDTARGATSHSYLKPALKVILPDGTLHWFEWWPPKDTSTPSPSELRICPYLEKRVFTGEITLTTSRRVHPGLPRSVLNTMTDGLSRNSTGEDRHTEDAMRSGRQRLE